MTDISPLGGIFQIEASLDHLSQPQVVRGSRGQEKSSIGHQARGAPKATSGRSTVGDDDCTEKMLVG